MPHLGELYIPPWVGLHGPIALGFSPAVFTATANGTFYINGGNVTTVTQTRNGLLVTLGIINGPAVARKGDIITVTYLVIPACVWVPM